MGILNFQLGTLFAKSLPETKNMQGHNAMSAHYIPDFQTERTTIDPLSHTPLPHGNTLELTRDNGFISGTQDIFDVLARIMTQAAEETITAHNERLKRLEDFSGRDSLTGLLNKRGFTKTFAKEVARTNRDLNQGGLLVIFNLENFETITQKYGEKAGIMALQLVTKALSLEIREMDSAARINDNEFVLLFAETSMEKALERLQRMALNLNKLSMIWAHQEIRLNLSLGLKTYSKGAQANDIFQSASDDLERNRKDHNPPHPEDSPRT